MRLHYKDKPWKKPDSEGNTLFLNPNTGKYERPLSESEILEEPHIRSNKDTGYDDIDAIHKQSLFPLYIAACVALAIGLQTCGPKSETKEAPRLNNQDITVKLNK